MYFEHIFLVEISSPFFAENIFFFKVSILCLEE